jgi:RNA polymerase sigma-70 factor (ECF subfamily)
VKLEDYEADVTSYAVEITKYLISRGAKLQDAEDIVQDTFIKMLELDIFIAPEKLRAWMYRVSIRSYIDKYRRAKHYDRLLMKLGHDLKQFEMPEVADKPELSRFFKQLKPRDEKLLRAYYYEQLSTKDLAARFDISLSKAKVDLHRARKKLKNLLEKEEIKSWNY